jgi:WD40 repeat protein
LFSLASVDPIAALGLSVSPDRHLLATTGGDSTVKVFDLESRSIRYRLPIGADETGGSVGFDPTGKLLAAIGADDRIYVWQIGSNSAERFLQVDAGSSGQYSSALAWLQAAQLAVLRPEGVIRVITLESADWQVRLNSLHFPDADPPRRSP